jgi:ABC-type transporter Mla MlaB component
MLKIDTIESASEIRLVLQGRLAGPWVDELECQWRRVRATAAERPIRVDLSGVTGIDRAARYLLQLMRVRNISLVDACLPVRASLDDEAAFT